MALAPDSNSSATFTDDARAAALAVLRLKLGEVGSGVDPELTLAGITLAGWHVERGTRSFGEFISAIVADLGDDARPYLRSWYLAAKYDPRLAGIKGMDSETTVEATDVTAPAELVEPVESATTPAGEGAQSLPATTQPVIQEQPIDPKWAQQIRSKAAALEADEEHLHNREMHARILQTWRETSPRMWDRLRRASLTEPLAMVCQAEMWDRQKALMDGGMPVTDAREQAERECLLLEPEDEAPSKGSSEA